MTRILHYSILVPVEIADPNVSLDSVQETMERAVSKGLSISRAYARAYGYEIGTEVECYPYATREKATPPSRDT